MPFISIDGRELKKTRNLSASMDGQRGRILVPCKGHEDPWPYTQQPSPVLGKKRKEISLIDFDHVSQTNSTILNTFMSLHVLTEFGRRVGGGVGRRGGHKSSRWDWQSCPRSLGPTRSGCKVAIYAARDPLVERAQRIWR